MQRDAKARRTVWSGGGEAEGRPEPKVLCCVVSRFGNKGSGSRKSGSSTNFSSNAKQIQRAAGARAKTRTSRCAAYPPPCPGAARHGPEISVRGAAPAGIQASGPRLRALLRVRRCAPTTSGLRPHAAWTAAPWAPVKRLGRREGARQGQTYPRSGGSRGSRRAVRVVQSGCAAWMQAPTGAEPQPPSLDQQLWLGRLGLVDDPPQPHQAPSVDFCPLARGKPDRALHKLLVGRRRRAATRTFGLFHLPIVFD